MYLFKAIFLNLRKCHNIESSGYKFQKLNFHAHHCVSEIQYSLFIFSVKVFKTTLQKSQKIHNVQRGYN